MHVSVVAPEPVPALPPAPPRRSTFVTVLSVIFIVLSAFWAATSLLQAALFSLMSFMPCFTDQMQKDMPPLSAFLFTHSVLFALANLAAAAAMLFASIGLHFRKNWARVLFIALLVLGIVYMIATVVVQIAFPEWSEVSIPKFAPELVARTFHAFMVVVLVAQAVMSVGFGVLFGWIIKRLLSPEVRREFQPIADRRIQLAPGSPAR